MAYKTRAQLQADIAVQKAIIEDGKIALVSAEAERDWLQSRTETLRDRIDKRDEIADDLRLRIRELYETQEVMFMQIQERDVQITSQEFTIMRSQRREELRNTAMVAAKPIYRDGEKIGTVSVTE